MLKTKQLTYCSQIKLLLYEIDLFFIEVISFNSTDNISQLNGGGKYRKIEKKYSIESNATEDNSLGKQKLCQI